MHSSPDQHPPQLQQQQQQQQHGRPRRSNLAPVNYRGMDFYADVSESEDEWKAGPEEEDSNSSGRGWSFCCAYI